MLMVFPYVFEADAICGKQLPIEPNLHTKINKHLGESFEIFKYSFISYTEY